jgi:F0F1-type ATP synthase membrane subunit c/vacuolar-type H+-ATPase subunit K
MTPQPQSPKAEHRFAVMLWAIMLFSLAMYYLVIRLVRPDQAVENPTLVKILLVLSGASAVASFAIRKYFEARARDARLPALRRTGLIIGLVLCEAAALFGVVVWFTTASPQYYIFLLIGIVAMLLHYPTRPD